MILTRRKLIGGMGLLFAAPAIVKASSLMKVKSLESLQVNYMVWASPTPALIFQVATSYDGITWVTEEGISPAAPIGGATFIPFEFGNAKEFRIVSRISPTAAGESAA